MTADKLDNLATALARVQRNLPHVGKTKTAQVKSDKANYSYKYADLADVASAILPLLGAEGLAFIARPTFDGDRFVLAYSLTHGPSGEHQDGVYPLPDPLRSTPQQIGGAITYARRYCLSSVTGVAADEDDDGRAASVDKAAHAPQRAARSERKAERGVAAEDPWAGHPVAVIPATDDVWVKNWETHVLAPAKSEQAFTVAWQALTAAFKEGKLTTADANGCKMALSEARELWQSNEVARARIVADDAGSMGGAL